MFSRTAFAFLLALTSTCLARGNAPEFPVSIVEGPLPSCLKALENQTGIELLYDREVVRNFRSPALVGRFTTESALQQILTETDLTVRRATSGAWIIERQTTPALAQQDAPVAEILVVGRRTQNADIRRIEDDVQPYTVSTREEIVRAHRDDIDQFFTSRITANTTVFPSHASQSAETISEINLRGLGSQDTLVLIDGRRMPAIPASYTGFRQSDLNGVPLHAIERIEVLTGAAGGIHGFGALGGVVNVVLDRNVDGIDVHMTQGISSRGDAHRQGLELKLGHTFRDGATDFMLFAAHNESDTVLAGDREYAVRDRRRFFELVPQYYPGEHPYGNSITVRSFIRLNEETGEFVLNPDLTFKPEFGGAPLGSNLTFLPIGFSGTTSDLTTALAQNAGRIDFDLDYEAAHSDLGSNPQSNALLSNIRHRFANGWEAYADAVVMHSRGESRGNDLQVELSGGSAFIAPESPANPFTDYITVDFPIAGGVQEVQKRYESTRYTAGLEADLWTEWRGTAEASWGGFDYAASTSIDYLLGVTSLFLGGDPSDLDTNPLGDWAAFQRSLGGEPRRTSMQVDVQSQFRAQSLRLAGPVFSTSAGPATLSLLAEHRSDSVPHYMEHQTVVADGTATTTDSRINSRSSSATSLYAELRSRLFDETATPILRELELQLAVRHDKQADDFSKDVRDADSELVHARFSGAAYTAGAKISPTSWLTLRGSYATGKQPPMLGTLVEQDPFTSTGSSTPDPKRGGTMLGAEGPFQLRWGGNAALETARATTVFFGAILGPDGDGPKFALDYSRIRRTRDLLTFSSAQVMAHEDHWPERVMRAPLTDADRASGYTAGRVTMVDTRYSSEGALDVDAFDLRADWPLTLLGGRLRLYADATYHKRNVKRTLFEPDIHLAGYREGPLKRRANGGFDWSTSQLTIGANLQYFGSSLVIEQGPAAGANDLKVEVQGSRHIPSQEYLDLYGSWRLPVRGGFGSVDSLTFDLGIINALDKSPPRESPLVTRGPGYSRYGDARQRRFELGLSVRF